MLVTTRWSHHAGRREGMAPEYEECAREMLSDRERVAKFGRCGAGEFVRDVMVEYPKTLPIDASIGSVRNLFENDHVHMVLLTDAGRLVTTLVPGDVLPRMASTTGARTVGRLNGRTVSPWLSADAVLEYMRGTSLRRLAVVDGNGMFFGLLCLKRSGTGFCSDVDVDSRIQARRGHSEAPRL